jgi:ABC-type multidrug transport system ATPase subunit
VVILSTHIVEDVEELCSRMAIIDRGEICSRRSRHARSPSCAAASGGKSVRATSWRSLEQELPVDLHEADGGADNRARLRGFVARREFECVEPDTQGRVLQCDGGTLRPPSHTTGEVAS